MVATINSNSTTITQHPQFREYKPLCKFNRRFKRSQGTRYGISLGNLIEAPDGPQVMGAGYSTALPTDVGADGDAARICTDRYGRVLTGIMPQAFQATFTSADAQAAAPVKVKTASRKMYILSLVVSVDTEMSVQFQDDTGPTVLIEGMYFAANGGAHLTYPPEAPLVVNTNEDFDIITSAAGNISVTITGNTISSTLDMRNLAKVVVSEMTRELRIRQRFSLV